MSKSFLQRRLESQPKYAIEASITGVTLPNGRIYWHVRVDGEADPAVAANILEMAAKVLRKGDD